MREKAKHFVIVQRRKRVSALKGAFFAMLLPQRFSLSLARSSCDTQSPGNDIKEDHTAKQVHILDRLLLPCSESRRIKERQAEGKRKRRREKYTRIFKERNISGKIMP